MSILGAHSSDHFIYFRTEAIRPMKVVVDSRMWTKPLRVLLRLQTDQVRPQSVP
jgi:hypothetical protein